MSSLHRITLLLVLCFAATSVFAADAVIKPLPSVDTSKLLAEDAKQLNALRADFDKKKVGLVDESLAEAYALMGAAYSRNGFVDNAVIAFYDASHLAPNDARWFYLQGVLAEQQKKTADAHVYYELAFVIDRVYFPIRFRLATAKIQEGNLEAAKLLMADYVSKQTDQAAPYSLLGEIALTQKKYGEAVDALKKSLALDPGANKLYGLLADAYIGLGDKAAADQARAKAGKQPIHMADPLVAGITPGGNATAEYLLARPVDPKSANDPVNLAMMYYSNHQYAQARPKLDEALKAYPNNPVLLGLYARIEAESGNLPKAKQRLQVAQAADAKSPAVLLSQGVIAEIGGDENAAADAYGKAVAADPNLGEARTLLGNSLMRRGQFVPAAEQYRALTTSKALDPNAYAHLVAAEVSAGHCADAFKDIDQASKAFPKDAFVAQIYVRVVSTCAAVRSPNIAKAQEIAQQLYNQSASVANGETLGLVMAAQGKFQEAADYQSGALFAAIRDKNKTTIALLNEFLEAYRAKKMPETPWPANHAYFKPQRLAATASQG
ncbi:tetratricopeptide repeat protein [Pseudolysobacter antarcticus]|uniref:Tetratricopeptide repeat protein n=1 Tax=Pseudolysobacter antarcticus TaxID=2511995 RepID=A0A411HNP7_9GAMM|nr:tetratricopeptide repeat protein [Pseudolysobacter antarcticus]QBB72094.1 tetratricopeptide repeat protein [Pseudolysobacter antarcticus]